MGPKLGPLALVALVAPSPGASSPDVREVQASPSGTAAAGLAFDFHSGFWINLHHFLYEQAEAASQAVRKHAPPPEVPASDVELKPEQRSAFDLAIAYYREHVVTRDLLRDDGLVEANDRLSDLEDATELRGKGLPDELAAALEGAAPAYRAGWWPKHDRVNRFWIAVAGSLVADLAAPMSRDVAAAFRAEWVKLPDRVDVVEYANWSGAYTTMGSQGRIHTTVASTVSGTQGFGALELLFHEASHSLVFPRSGRVAEAIAKAAADRHREVPPALWHSLLFYTAGELSRRHLAERGVAYKPWGFDAHLYQGDWEPLSRHWQAYLEGKLGFEEAIARVVDELPQRAK